MENKNRKNIRFENDLVGICFDMWEKRVCPICNTVFYARKKYEKITCSSECYKKYVEINKDEINKKRSASLKLSNSKKSIEEKRNELAKARKTCIERYGVDMYQKTDEYRKYMSERFKEKDWSNRSKLINEKLLPKYKTICDGDNLELLEFRNRFDCTVKCKKCGNIFDIHVLGYLTDKTNHNLCRHCYPNVNSTSETKPIKFIEDILTEYGVQYIKNDRKLIAPYEIDIYIPEMKIGFEVNGNYWHSEFSCGKGKEYHLDKTKKAYEQGIKLIQIFEDEIINKPDIVSSRVVNIINATQNKVFARNCNVVEINSKVKKLFLESNHIDGDSVSKYNYGLYYNGELISVATFGCRKISKKAQFELIRYANKINTNVVGGFSKLLQHFLKEIKADSLVTYADVRWSGIDPVNTVYYKNGFSYLGLTKPNYFYEDKKKYIVRLNRLNYTKQKLIKRGYDPNKTEAQIMLENGYDRIWDCGSMKFIYETKREA